MRAEVRSRNDAQRRLDASGRARPEPKRRAEDAGVDCPCCVLVGQRHRSGEEATRSDFQCRMLIVPLQDDVFASLDNEVVGFIYEKCIRALVSRYQRTIILVTQKTQLVYSADHVSRGALMILIHPESSPGSAEKLSAARRFPFRSLEER